MTRLENLCKQVGNNIFIVILVLLSCLGIVFTTNIIGPGENLDINFINPLILITVTVLICLFLLIVKKTKTSKIDLYSKKKFILPAILAIYAIVNIAWINIIQFEPIDDAKTVHDIAVVIANNKMDTLKNSVYLEKCPQQIGMSLFFALIYKIFGSTNYQIIQYLNIIANILTIIGIYKITKKIDSKNKMAEIISFIMTIFFIPLTLLTTYVYSDYIGLSLIIWSIYFIIYYQEKEKYKDITISGILMSIACIIKTNYLVSLIAIMIYLIINLINNHKDLIKKVILIILYLSIVLIPYVSIKNIVSNKLELVVSESIPTTGYLYVGMSNSYKGPGWYGPAIQPAWDDATESRTIYPTLIKKRVKHLITHPFECIKFYSKKIVSGWEDPLFQSLWYNVTPINDSINWDYIIKHPVFILSSIVAKSILLLTYIFSLVYTYISRRKINSNALLLEIIFIGGFLFHLLWEMKSRYTLPYFVIIIPLAAIGISKFIDFKYKTLIKNKNKVIKR